MLPLPVALLILAISALSFHKNTHWPWVESNAHPPLSAPSSSHLLGDRPARTPQQGAGRHHRKDCLHWPGQGAVRGSSKGSDVWAKFHGFPDARFPARGHGTHLAEQPGLGGSAGT